MNLADEMLVVSGLQDDAQESLKTFLNDLLALTSESVVE
jgi:hypothetical protein